ncbi:MAG: hypothetical protein RL220_1826 [Bacteroidota bacterium]
MTIHGHRGCRGLRTENSIDSCTHAFAAGAEYIEIDIVVTSDHKLLVSHDPWMNAVLCSYPDGSIIRPEEEKDINIYMMTLSEAQQFRIGDRPEPRFPFQQTNPGAKPALKEVMDCISQLTLPDHHPRGLNIEIKSREGWDGLYHPAPDVYVDLLLNELESYGYSGKIILQSFDPRILIELQRRNAPYPLVFLTETEPDPEKVMDLFNFSPWGIGVHHGLITRDYLVACRERGVELLAWTVNEEHDIMEMMKLGVRHLITDYPDRAARCRSLFFH